MKRFLKTLLEKLHLKRPLLAFLDVIQLGMGLVYYKFKKTTPKVAHMSMVRLFCASRGRSNDLVSGIIDVLHPPYMLKNTTGTLGDLSKKQEATIDEKLKVEGFYIFDSKLSDDLCDRLLNFSLSMPCLVPVEIDGKPIEPLTAKYDRKNPLGVRYLHHCQDLLNNPDVQTLIADLSIIQVAQNYLGCQPILDQVSMWWNTAFSDKPNSEAAQYYHFDMDRFKWIKFFLYLTDVTERTGPHKFIARSHQTGGIPTALLKKGYARLDDSEVEKFYDKSRFIEITGNKGTILAEDTRGLHKGQNIIEGDRLLLQLQFSNSLFGAKFPKSTLSEIQSPSLRQAKTQYPSIYSNFS